jgi:hypothetical protein
MLDIDQATIEKLTESVKIFSEESLANLKTKGVNVELEIRQGKFFSKESKERTFISGVSYDEFSRFFTFFSDNAEFSKVNDDISLDIGVKIAEKYIRITLNGTDEIMNYCKSNVFNLNSDNVSYGVKEKLSSENLTDVQSRLAVSKETNYTLNDLLEELEISKEDFGSLIYKTDKTFRYKQRTSFITKALPFRFDLTQIKSVINKRGQIVPEKNLVNSEVFNVAPVFEVEAEFVYNSAVKDLLKDTKQIRKFIEIVLELSLMIRQDNEVVISRDETNRVMRNFMRLRFNKTDIDWEYDNYFNKPVVQYHKIFPGAKVSTLEMNHLSPDNIPYIYKNYCVTDKADGERYMLYIDPDRFIYLVNDRLEVVKTDTRVSAKYANSMIDGELIVSLVNGVKQYTFYGFDVLFVNDSNVCDLPLFPTKSVKETRHKYLLDLIADIEKAKITTINGVPILLVRSKKYYSLDYNEISPEKMKGFCSLIWDNKVNFPYHLDGLIFTPIDEGYPLGRLWANTLKWKPPSDNSIDFLVKFKTGDDEFAFEKEGETITKYRVGELYSGELIETGKYKDYVETRFDVPNSLSGEPTYLIKIPVDSNGDIRGTRDNLIIRDETIVECVWDYTKKGWVVLKTRLDKTQRYLESGKKISGTANNIAVATNIWKTIIEFISEQLITGKVSLDEHLKSRGEAYYSKSGTDITQPLRSFNNFVKSLLIGGARFAGDSLLDLSCGRGGDLYKWKASKYNRIVGLDYSRNGIENLNPEFGAYGRLLSLRSKGDEWAKTKDIKFFWADTSKMTTSRYPNGICNATKKLEAVEALKTKFNVITSFFTAHYYFENRMKIRGFMQNIHDNITNNGYALITTFDAEVVNKALENIKKGNSIRGLVDKSYVWEIRKDYKKNVAMVGDESSVGLQISVKFESISDEFIPEWLVHKEYLQHVASQYGLVLISPEEAMDKFGLSQGSALFEDLLNRYDPDITDELEKLRRSELGKIFGRDIEKLYDGKYLNLRQFIKFNRYYIFKKIPSDPKIPREWEGHLKDIHCTIEEPASISEKAEVAATPIVKTPLSRTKPATIEDLEREVNEPVIILKKPPPRKIVKVAKLPEAPVQEAVAEPTVPKAPVVAQPQVVSEPLVIAQPQVVSEPVAKAPLVAQPQVVSEPPVVAKPVKPPAKKLKKVAAFSEGSSVAAPVAAPALEQVPPQKEEPVVLVLTESKSSEEELLVKPRANKNIGLEGSLEAPAIREAITKNVETAAPAPVKEKKSKKKETPASQEEVKEKKPRKKKEKETIFNSPETTTATTSQEEVKEKKPKKSTKKQSVAEMLVPPVEQALEKVVPVITEVVISEAPFIPKPIVEDVVEQQLSEVAPAIVEAVVSEAQAEAQAVSKEVAKAEVVAEAKAVAKAEALAEAKAVAKAEAQEVAKPVFENTGIVLDEDELALLKKQRAARRGKK